MNLGPLDTRFKEENQKANSDSSGAVSAESAQFEIVGAKDLLDESEVDPTSLDKCCICLERKRDVILPCTHSYFIYVTLQNGDRK